MVRVTVENIDLIGVSAGATLKVNEPDMTIENIVLGGSSALLHLLSMMLRFCLKI